MANKPIFKAFAKGVQVLTWKNEKPITKNGVTNILIDYKCKPENTYINKQGIRVNSDYFEIEKIPQLILSLQKTYEEFTVKCYREGKEVKDMLEE